MFADLFSGWHLLIVLGVFLLLFGATKLPALAKGIGQSVKIFRREISSVDDETPTRVDAAEPGTPVRTKIEPVAKP